MPLERDYAYNFGHNEVNDLNRVGVTLATHPDIASNGTTDVAPMLSRRLAQWKAAGIELVIANNFKYLIGTDLTIPAGMTLRIERGAILDIASGVTLTGVVEAGRYQVFTGAGAVVLGSEVDKVFPEWFGAVNDGTTNNQTNLLAALTAMNTNGGILAFGDGTYNSTLITLTSISNIRITGTPKTVLTCHGGTSNGYFLFITSNDLTFDNLTFDLNTVDNTSSGVSARGFNLQGCTRVQLRDIRVVDNDPASNIKDFDLFLVVSTLSGATRGRHIWVDSCYGVGQVELDNLSDFMVTNCIFDNVSEASTIGCYILGNNQTIENGVIAHNIIIDSRGQPIKVQTDPGAHTGVTIRNIKITDNIIIFTNTPTVEAKTTNGIRVGAPTTPAPTGTISGITIENNEIYFPEPQDVEAVTLSGSSAVRITITAHGYFTGKSTLLRNLGGSTELNTNTYVVTRIDANNFDLDGTDSSTITAYTSGGTASKVYGSGIFFRGQSTMTIDKSHARNNKIYGNGSDIGIEVRNFKNGSIMLNYVKDFDDGIVMSDSIENAQFMHNHAEATNRAFRAIGASGGEDNIYEFNRAVGDITPSTEHDVTWGVLNRVVTAEYMIQGLDITPADITHTDASDFIIENTAAARDLILRNTASGQVISIRTQAGTVLVLDDNRIVTIGAGGVVLGSGNLGSLHVHRDSGSLPSIASATSTVISRSANAASDVFLTLISGNAAQARLIFGNTDAELRGAVEYDHAASPEAINFFVAGASRATLDANAAFEANLVTKGGVTGSRPGSPIVYQIFFDTTLGIPIFWDGTNWVDATGSTV